MKYKYYDYLPHQIVFNQNDNKPILKKLRNNNLIKIKKYIEAANSNKNAMAEIKYIIIPNINNNIKEVKSFLNKYRNKLLVKSG